MGTTEVLARYLVDTRYSDIPDEAVEAAKRLVLDCLGATLRGSRERVSQIAIKYVKDSGGIAESGVIGGGFSTSLTNAAFVNGTSAHALELESVGRYSGSNICTVIPAALGLAEKFKLSGKALLEGVILGFEIQGRIGLGCPGGADHGFCSIPLLGPLGSGATAARMMNLSVEQTRMAFGIAISQSGGLYRQTGSMSHLLESGLGCRDGITAAMLAKEGMTADPDLIEVDGGFVKIFCTGEGAYDLERITKGLGHPFYIVSPGTAVKKHGCCWFNHRPLDALLQLIKERAIRYEEVDYIQVDVPSFVSTLLRFPNPKCGEEAKFSLQHSLGAALVEQKTDLRMFSDEGAMDPRYQEARKKVRVVVHDEWPRGRVMTELPVIVKLRNGSEFSKSLDVLTGTPARPLSLDELRARYEVCVSGILSAKQISRSADLVLNLDKLEDTLELMDLVTFGGR